MALYDHVWPHMAQCGPIWLRVGPIQTRMTQCGPVWPCMAPYGPVWTLWAHMAVMAQYGSVCPHMAPYGPIWPCIAPFGPEHLFLTSVYKTPLKKVKTSEK